MVISALILLNVFHPGRLLGPYTTIPSEGNLGKKNTYAYSVVPISMSENTSFIGQHEENTY
jgi:hypothetical protein